MKTLFRGLLAGLALAATSALAAYPEQPIRVVVPFPPGGGTDIVARNVLERVSHHLGQPIIIENKAGAGTQIGTVAVANAEPDGYTLLFTSTAFSVTPSLRTNANYDPIQSFQPIGMAALHPFVLVANPSLPANTVAELIAYAKKHPGELNYASVGNGSSQHLGMELFKRMAGIDLLHVPYNGSAPAMTDLLGGQVSLMFNGVSPTLGHIRSGKLKALATDNLKRVPLLDGVPTVDESGLPGFEITTWSGFLAPKGIPADALDKLEDAMSRAMAEPQLQERLTSRGLQPNPLNAADFEAFLVKDVAQWRQLIKDAGVKPDSDS